MAGISGNVIRAVLEGGIGKCMGLPYLLMRLKILFSLGLRRTRSEVVNLVGRVDWKRVRHCKAPSYTESSVVLRSKTPETALRKD